MYGGGEAEGIGDLGRKIYIVGDWSGFEKFEEMRETCDSDGNAAYSYTVEVGENLRRQFFLVLDEDPELAIYPIVHRAGHRARVAGPDGQRCGKSWLLDGQSPGAGTYTITFAWTEKGKRLSWDSMTSLHNLVVTGSSVSVQDAAIAAPSVVSVVGSWTKGELVDMSKGEDEGDGFTLLETSLRIGSTGQEEFYFVQNHDCLQAIYPGEARTTDVSVAINGPAENKAEHAWVISGESGESVVIELRVNGAAVTVTTLGKSQGEQIWSTQH